MKRLTLVLIAVVTLAAAGCVSFSFGKPFPSPGTTGTIAQGKTTKEDLRAVYGEPYQVGLDNGDQTWRWFYGNRHGGSETTKDFTVRFNPDGTVKSYSFISNFPDDMSRLR